MQSWPTEPCLCVRRLNVCQDKEGRWPGEVFISVSSYFKECPAFSSIAAMTLVIDLGDLDSPAVVDLTLLAPLLILLMLHHHSGNKLQTSRHFVPQCSSMFFLRTRAFS